MSTIRIEVVAPIETGTGPIFVTGNTKALGAWTDMLPMSLSGQKFSCEIEADGGDHLEYKFTRGSWETEAVDASGNVPENYKHDVWRGTSLRHTIADWKDEYSGRLANDRVQSKILASERSLRIWLPGSYALDPTRRYPVLYMNDGDNVFDPETSPISGVDWAADEWIRALAKEGAMPEMIVVSICHPDGFAEGMTSLRDVDLSLELGGEAYAEFVAHEVVPYIDSRYRTLAQKDARILAGGSLGGLNAVYTGLTFPEVFGKIAALSASFEDVSQLVPDQADALRRIRDLDALPQGARFYLDYGTSGLDECYEPYFREVGDSFRAKGWEDGREFKIVRVVDGSHDEFSWRDRFGDALRFLSRR